MRARNRAAKYAAGAIGSAAVVATGVAMDRKGWAARRATLRAADTDRLGSMRGDIRPVRAPDGLELYAEVDEVAPYTGTTDRPVLPTLVFVHGFALNLDSWHFQRAYFRGKRRMVFYDHRSHGQSERSPREHATIDQLGLDLKAVIDQLVPGEQVVLVGHSMGGMTIMALAEHHPEIFGDRVVGVGLVATTAGGLRTHKILSRAIPDRLGSVLTPRLLGVAGRVPRLMDSARTRGRAGFLITDAFAFGSEVPRAYVEFVDRMLASTPFEVLAEFFPQFDELEKFDVIASFDAVPTWILGGTGDKLTTIGHARKMHARIAGSRLVELPGAGHMVMMECKDQVNTALAELCAAADRVAGGERAS